MKNERRAQEEVKDFLFMELGGGGRPIEDDVDGNEKKGKPQEKRRGYKEEMGVWGWRRIIRQISSILENDDQTKKRTKKGGVWRSEGERSEWSFHSGVPS